MVSSTVTVHLPNGTVYERAKPSNAHERDEHGLGAYQGGCRCPTCRAARRRYDRDWYATRQALRSGVVNRRVSARRTAQHLEELRAAGWPWAKLAAESGFSVVTLGRIAAHPERRCWLIVERAVCSIEL